MVRIDNAEANHLLAFSWEQGILTMNKALIWTPRQMCDAKTVEFFRLTLAATPTGG